MTGSERIRALARAYHAGTLLFEENDPGSRMYVIRSGKVRIFRRVGSNEIVLAFLGPGDFFGEMALLERMPRSASAEVVEDSELIEVDADTFDEMIRSNKTIALRIMRSLAARVRELDQRVQSLTMESGLARTVEVLRWLLPQGKPEGEKVRVSHMGPHELAIQAGLSSASAQSVLRHLADAGCLHVEGTDLMLGSKRTLEDFAEYLDLRLKYERDRFAFATEATSAEQRERVQAMERFLEALQISPAEVDHRRAALAAQHQRYLGLKERFGTLDV